MFTYASYEHGHSMKIYVKYFTVVIIKPNKVCFQLVLPGCFTVFISTESE